MRIGYACKLVGVVNTDMKSCVLKNATREKLTELIKHNISSLDVIIDYNIANNIQIFRISSDLIPFGSHEVNDIKWWEVFREELNIIGNKIKESNMRVSVHPGQYTVLNSYKNQVVEKAVEELVYHTRILDSLDMNPKHKIVLHIGGAYDNKILSIERFIENYRLLPENVKKRLVIENDDKIYNIKEVLSIAGILHIPVIFDNLHNQINPSKQNRSEGYWIEQCKGTWKEEDGDQKIHYSQQAEQKKIGSHSEFIEINQFMSFYEILGREDIDIMLEVKDKNLSCIKCINCTTKGVSIHELEKEWSKYKYTILERSNPTYLKIRELLKEKEEFFAIDFYNLLEAGLEKEGDCGSVVNAALHVWGYFKKNATKQETDNFFRYLGQYQNQKIGIVPVKNHLKKLATKYQQNCLLNSLYFTL
jgi:UV DNA damage endonuclease